MVRIIKLTNFLVQKLYENTAKSAADSTVESNIPVIVANVLLFCFQIKSKQNELFDADVTIKR